MLAQWIRFVIQWADLLVIAVAIVLLILWGSGVLGCVAPGARQGTIESTVVTQADLNAAMQTVVDVVVELHTSLKVVVGGFIEEIEQTSHTTQKAAAAISMTDQSTSDKWLNRGLVVGLVAIAVLVVLVMSYPIGKRRWLRQDRGCTSNP